jgi:membrane protease YdiL (CAAX protease family)
MDIGFPSAAPGATKVVSGGRFATALRVLFPLTLLEAALWTPLPLAILCGVSALWYMSWHLLRSASGNAGVLGLELRGLLREPWLLGATFALALAVLTTAYFSGSLHRLWGLQNPWYAIVGYSCWALVQEFMLQCFFLRMLSALVSRAGSLVLSGVVFSMAHLPNPGLTLLTFFAGIAFTAIYARKRNLYVVALVHAILGLTLAVSAPESWFHGLNVGRDFLESPSTIAAEISPRR